MPPHPHSPPLPSAATAARRRALRALLGVASLGLAACSSLGMVGALLGDQLTFTAPQLQAYMERRFPRDYEKLGGLVKLQVSHPRLSIPPGGQRLQVDFDIGLAGPGSIDSRHVGRLAVASGLRFDTGTRGLHLDAPTLVGLDMPSLGGTMNATGRELVNRWLADYARDEPVYRFDDSLLARIGARRIGRTTIENGQVVVHMDP